MYKNFKAEWTGSYPCLCSGEWILTAETTEYDEVRGAYSVTEDISHLIPEQYIEVFRAFQKNDWRHNSCGGCI